MAIPGVQTINFVSNVDMAVVVGRVLQITKAEWWGLYASATVKNPSQASAGTIRYFTPELSQLQDYTQGNKNDNPKQPRLFEEAMTLNLKYKIVIEKETLDFAGIESPGAIEGEIAKSLTVPLFATLDAELLDIVQAQAILNGTIGDGTGNIAATTPGYMIKPDWGTSRTEADFKEAFYDIVDLTNNLAATVDNRVVGIPKAALIKVGRLGYKSRILGFTKTGSKGSADLQSGNLPGVDGNENLQEHGIIGQSYIDSWPYYEDKSYDFSKLEFLVMLNEAQALTFIIRDAWSERSPNSGNIYFGTKGVYDKKILEARSDHIRAIFNDDPIPAPFFQKRIQELTLSGKAIAKNVEMYRGKKVQYGYTATGKEGLPGMVKNASLTWTGKITKTKDNEVKTYTQAELDKVAAETKKITAKEILDGQAKAQENAPKTYTQDQVNKAIENDRKAQKQTQKPKENKTAQDVINETK